MIVVKVGGSLFDLPDLRERLLQLLSQCGPDVLLVPGGGRAADIVRHLDTLHGLGEESAHWLAVQAMTFNAHFLAELIPGAVVGADPAGKGLAVLDAAAFLRMDDPRPGALPHTWDVTSDSIAARAAVVAGADELILLKSVSLKPGMTWEEAARTGVVDPVFPASVAGLRVRLINWREPGP